MALINSSSFAYDVFLSFRGEDTRFGITGYLYRALTNKGIHTFIDDEVLRWGEEIGLSLVKAIKESRIAIIVLSKDYASSSFCLNELATIVDCSESKGMLVIPVFYEVDPADVRHQRGSYGEALTKHEESFQHNPDKLQKWKMALRQVADLSGYHFKKGDYEYEIINEIVASVSKEINHPARLSVPDDLVGLESQKAEVMKLLDVGSDDGIHFVGIYGMGGIGKSTLTRVVYNDLLAKKLFDGSFYLENVREVSREHGGLTHLQSIILREILGDENINVTSVEEGASMIKDRLQGKKVLLLVDDVDDIDVLDAIVRSRNWFSPGSRIIITTRYEQLLKSGNVKRRYEVKKLDEKAALQLLTWKAFKKDKADFRFAEVLNLVVTYASGLPLALEVIGSHLCGRSIYAWQSAIDQYMRIPPKGIQDILKVSFDALQDEEKSVFLDIACCFNGYELAEVEDILGAHYGHCMKHSIAVLVDKSLVQISDSIKPCYGTVTLHDHLIVDMCREIDRQESPREPNKRRRLWLPQDVVEVLEENSGTSKIEIICLNFPLSDEEKIVQWDGKAFRKMQNLKTLIIRNGNFSNGPEYLPNSLRVLEWWRYPSHCLPSDFHPKELAICKLPCSRISTIELTNLLKNFVNLRVLKFSSAMFNEDTEFGESSI